MSQFLPLSILSGSSAAPRRRRSLGCGRRRPGSGPPAPERRDWRGSAATRERASGGAWPKPKRGCGSGTETGLDRECPREPEDDGEERKLHSLEAVRGFHRFGFSSLAAVAFFSVCLEPLRNGGRVGGPAVLDRSVVVDEVWGISNSSPTAARARPVLRDPCPDALRSRGGSCRRMLITGTMSLSREA